MDLHDPNIKKLGWGVFFVSMSVLFFELSLIRLFSVVLFPSLAFLGITVVFFGLTLGGLIVYFLPSLFSGNKFYSKLSILAFVYGLSVFIFIPTFLNINPASSGISVFQILWNSAIPITIANVYLAYVFTQRSSSIGKLYFLDLVGAGLGVVLCLILLSHVSAVGVMAISGFIALLSSVITAPDKKHRYTFLIILISLIAVFFINKGFPELKYTKRGLEKNIIFSKWNSFSRVTLIKEPLQRFVYSLPSTDIQTVEQLGIEIDADAYTSVLNFDGNLKSVDFLRKDLSSLAYHLATPEKALIIGPGGGRDVLMALLFGNKVTGVDINPIIVNDIMRGRLKEYSGNLYLRPDVNIIIAEGRSYIKKDTYKYNTINLPLVDTWASTAAGNLAIVEGYLYTTEAMEDYLRHLSEGGILTISRWSVDGTKLISLFLEVSEKIGLKDAPKNIAIVGRTHEGAGLYNYMFKNGPFTEKELGIINKFVKDNGFSKIYIPNEKLDNTYNSFLLSANWRDFIDKYPTNIAPSTDDKPFFFFTLPVSRLLKFEFVSSYLPDGGLGLALKTAIMFTIICLALPFIFAFKKVKGLSRNAFLFLSYFTFIGFSFMLIEISLMQKFILYLEYPIYSYSVVIATLLVFAGLGSLMAQKKDTTNKTFGSIVGGILVFFALYMLLVVPLVSYTIGLNIFYKIPLTVLITAPLAFLMGMMMPLGIKRLNSFSMDQLIPWCWAMNGSASILASVGAVILALLYGFKMTMAIGIAGYALALLCIWHTRLSDK